MSDEEISRRLFLIHTHGELCHDDEIVYREADVIKLLNDLGYLKTGLNEQ